MKRFLTLIIVAAPLLMCFQCGCDEPDSTTTLCIENSTGEELYLSQSKEPWANADCNWRKLPYTLHRDYDSPLTPGEHFGDLMRGNGTRYVLLVDINMRLRACWSVDSLPTADSTRWLSDTALLDYTNCNDIHPTAYTHTFTLLPEDLLQQ